MSDVTRKQIEDAFNDADWPMTKDEVVAHAEQRGDDAVTRAVRSLPLGEYARLEDVVAGVDAA